jgi:sec-independent protein translocase protein TatA
MQTHVLALFGVPHLWEFLIILAVALLIFGPRIPGIARSLGRGIVEFRKGLKGEDDDDVEPASGKRTLEGGTERRLPAPASDQKGTR